jgi:hypothetical protein
MGDRRRHDDGRVLHVTSGGGENGAVRHLRRRSVVQGLFRLIDSTLDIDYVMPLLVVRRIAEAFATLCPVRSLASNPP